MNRRWRGVARQQATINKASSASGNAARQEWGAGSRVHASIKNDVDRLKQLANDSPRYRPNGELDAPHLLKLIHAAVVYANSLSPHSKANNFIYHGQRYPLLFTTLGRVIVCDQKGNKIGASSYDAIN